MGLLRIVPTDRWDELVFTVFESKATPVGRIAIEELGLTERARTQTWLISHQEIIGPDAAGPPAPCCGAVGIRGSS